MGWEGKKDDYRRKGAKKIEHDEGRDGRKMTRREVIAITRRMGWKKSNEADGREERVQERWESPDCLDCLSIASVKRDVYNVEHIIH